MIFDTGYSRRVSKTKRLNEEQVDSSVNTAEYDQWIAETPYGRHLKSDELFEKHIGAMDDPLIVICNAYTDEASHAFLVFKNIKNDEYCSFHIRQGPYYPEYMNNDETIKYFQKEKKHVVGAVSLGKLAQQYGDTLDAESITLLRDIFKARMKIEGVPYCIQNQNCMTFSMLAFAATRFDLEGFLKKVGLNNFHTPYHIIRALAQSEKTAPLCACRSTRTPA